MTSISPSSPPTASPSRLRSDLAIDLRVTILRLSRRIRSESVAGDLSEAQNCVLSALTSNGPMTPRALAERDGVRPPTMTRTLAGLESAELVARSAHPTDRRQVRIALTDDGVAYVERLRRRRSAWLATRLRTLSDDERATLAAAEVILRRVTAE